MIWLSRRWIIVGWCVSMISGVVELAAAGPWQLEAGQSRISFTGTQTGASFEGAFKQFSADIRFDPKTLATNRFDVTIDLKSVDSKDNDRDMTIKGPDFFATGRWPTAHFVADRFTDKGVGKYAAVGKLTLRDVSREVPVEFLFQTNSSGTWLKGSAVLRRLDFGVGQGEWRSTEWVGNEVKVQFALKLKS